MIFNDVLLIIGFKRTSSEENLEEKNTRERVTQGSVCSNFLAISRSQNYMGVSHLA